MSLVRGKFNEYISLSTAANSSGVAVNPCSGLGEEGEGFRTANPISFPIQWRGIAAISETCVSV